MSLYGWIVLALSVGGTTGSLIWCFARVIRNLGKTDRLHATTDLDPHDADLELKHPSAAGALQSPADAGFKPENLGRAVSPRTPALNSVCPVDQLGDLGEAAAT